MFSSGTMVLEAWNRANATSAVGSRSGIYQYQYSYTAAQSACGFWCMRGRNLVAAAVARDASRCKEYSCILNLFIRSDILHVRCVTGRGRFLLQRRHAQLEVLDRAFNAV